MLLDGWIDLKSLANINSNDAGHYLSQWGYLWWCFHIWWEMYLSLVVFLFCIELQLFIDGFLFLIRHLVDQVGRTIKLFWLRIDGFFIIAW